jgi:uncharacterized protein YjbI with pentapeptide repeats
MDPVQLKEILHQHSLWLKDPKSGKRADLSEANLSGAVLNRVDLNRANLYGAVLSGAVLNRANLYGADLSGANLNRANLYGVDLSGANLSGADLGGADLGGAVLNEAILNEAFLYGAKFTIELRNVKNLDWIKYDSEQFSWLSLNPVFLGSVKIPTSIG